VAESRSKFPSENQEAWRIASLYAVFSLLWIYGSDQILLIITRDPDRLGTYQTAKGWIFVLTTAVLINFLVRHAMSRARAAQEKAKENQALLEGVVEGTNDVIFVKDLLGRYLLFNQAAATFMGTPREKVLGQNDHALFSPMEAEAIMADDRRIMASGRITTYEETLSTGNGKISFLVTKGPLRDNAGQVIGLFGITRDISGRKQMEEELRASEERYRLLFDEMMSGFALHEIVCGEDGSPIDYRFLKVNAEFQRLTGLRGSDIIDRTVLEVLPHNERHWIDRYGKVALTGESMRFEEYSNELEKFFEVRAFSPEKGKFAVMFHDITERKNAEKALEESERRYRYLFEKNPHPMWVYDLETLRFLAVNDAAVARYGYSREEFLTMTLLNIRPEADGPLLVENIGKVSSGIDEAGIWRHRKKDGTEILVEITSHTLKFQGRRAEVVLANDVTERIRYQEQLAFQATHDALTGLANRNLLADRLSQGIAHVQRTKRQMAVLLLDLDRFKIINDSLGHDQGDNLLKMVAARLASAVRAEDTVARLGGDEFVLALVDIADLEDLLQVVEKIQETLYKPFFLAGKTLHLSASLGGSFYPQDGQNGETLIRNADIAMYQAKEAGRNTFRFFSPEMNSQVVATMELESDLRNALERGEFLLHFQPKVDVVHGKIVGSEALVRWLHPHRGLVQPDDFIPLAEETGLIDSLGIWVLREACARQKSWQRQGLPPMTIAVNLSAREFRQENLPETVERILREANLESRWLELELTESMVMQDPDRVGTIMNQLKQIGVSLSLDDFGTGYSSLNYLGRFPFDSLKIDRSFVGKVITESSAKAVAASIIAIAHSLNVPAIAEGVETKEQLAYLTDCRCDTFQGYLFSPPLPADQFASLVMAPPVVQSA